MDHTPERRRQFRRVDFHLDTAQDVIAVREPAQALVGQARVGKRFQQQPAESARRERRGDFVNIVLGVRAARQITAIGLPRERRAAERFDSGRLKPHPGSDTIVQLGAKARFPGRDQAGKFGQLVGDPLLGGRDPRFLVRHSPRQIGRGDREHRIRIARLALQRAAFRHVVEERKELVELALRNRIVFVIVAAAAIEGQSQPCHARGFHSVDDRFDPPFLRNNAAFSIESMVAIEAGRQDLLRRSAGQQVAGELFDGELVERHVAVERVDHPIAPRPHLPAAVDLKAVAVGEASEVEPLQRHPLAVARRIEESIHEAFVGSGSLIGEHRVDFQGSRGNAGQVQ